MTTPIPTLAGNIRQTLEKSQWSLILPRTSVGVVNSSEQDIRFFMTGPDGVENHFDMPGHSSWELSDGSSVTLQLPLGPPPFLCLFPWHGQPGSQVPYESPDESHAS